MDFGGAAAIVLMSPGLEAGGVSLVGLDEDS